jgi:hypothetical protein
MRIKRHVAKRSSTPTTPDATREMALNEFGV